MGFQKGSKKHQFQKCNLNQKALLSGKIYKNELIAKNTLPKNYMFEPKTNLA